MQPYMGLGNSLQTAQASVGGGGGIGGWVELGRTTLGSAANIITVSSLPDKRYYKYFLDTTGVSANFTNHLRLNGDTGSNYSKRYSVNGGGDSTQVNYTSLFLGINGTAATTPNFTMGYLSNLSTKEKLGFSHSVRQLTAGAGTAPHRDEIVHKHAQTTNPINSITATSTSASTFNTGTELVVLGWDPADTHTTNFWEELADVTAGSNVQTLSTGTFTAKKYLWIQASWLAAGTSRPNIRLGSTTLDTGSNYADRNSDTGGADVTSVNQSEAEIGIGGGGSGTRYFFNGFIINNAANEKLGIFHSVWGSTAGAGAAPNRTENTFKWANTSNQCNILALYDTTVSTAIGTGSQIKVWGSD